MILFIDPNNDGNMSLAELGAVMAGGERNIGYGGDPCISCSSRHGVEWVEFTLINLICMQMTTLFKEYISTKLGLVTGYQTPRHP